MFFLGKTLGLTYTFSWRSIFTWKRKWHEIMVIKSLMLCSYFPENEKKSMYVASRKTTASSLPITWFEQKLKFYKAFLCHSEADVFLVLKPQRFWPTGPHDHWRNEGQCSSATPLETVCLSISVYRKASTNCVDLEKEKAEGHLPKILSPTGTVIG